MASTSDIAAVRINVAEPDNSVPFTDEVVGALIDASGVTGATVAIWRQKAASVAGLVNVSEAGASHSASDLFDHANKMLGEWSGVLTSETTPAATGPRVKKIVRTS